MRPRDNKRARLLPTSTIDALENDLLIRCASYLDADGLAQLGRTSARFGIPQAGQQRSFANEAARQQFREIATDEERKCLPKYADESNVGLCRALELLRLPLRFDKLVGDGFFSHQEHPACVTYTGIGWSTAMSGRVMRGGRHFVEFAISHDEQSNLNIFVGVVRPVSLTNGIDMEADWQGKVFPMYVSSSYAPAVAEKLRSQTTAKWGVGNVHCCAFFCGSGYRRWTDWGSNDSSQWRGLEGLGESGTVGLLLDLDEGTLTVFKNGRRLGVMKDGLGGEYIWFVSVYSPCTISMSEGTAPN